jgi:hypothetical protein
MAGCAKSVYLTVSDKVSHRTIFHKVFFTAGDLKVYIASEEFKAKYPAEQFNIVKETY